MATIKDIAKYAGVSHGTVSNVLNRRGNVSAEKIKLVEQAAKDLGYQMNVQASKLRSAMHIYGWNLFILILLRDI
ncbi:MAG TPA: LacI family DNA-binding transcriptional regulator [Candidatus Blautia merdigallinarum]|uniref:LacI family DNA-binding transcriptional regulator n=1 Tax=Candidatus Blautia merdigallinarum TaxID=2838495 RepID=A0A9D2N6Y0_9FIRM|nr:LacI family DNA-binding transcriptional regulator [Candidatus Blautia merdigallinarum]